MRFVGQPQEAPSGRSQRLSVRAFLGSALLRRLLLFQLVLALVPFAVIAAFALQSMREAQQVVVERSRRGFDAQAFEHLRQRDVALATSVAAFLRERESDLRLLATLPRDSEAYAAFGNAKRGTLWTVDDQAQERFLETPLYRELAFVDATGREMVKATNTCRAYPDACTVEPAQQLVAVADPANTLYRNETYFAETARLPAGGLYVGRPVGSYIPYERAYAAAQRRDGERYRGILRFATPVYEGGAFVGEVVLGLEMIHLLEQIAHVAPGNPLPQAEVDPREADFTYAVDPDGWAIAHPRHFNIAGVDEQGRPVPGINAEDRADPSNLFRPGNLAQMGFIDPILPRLVNDNQVGDARTGQTGTATPFQGRERAIAWATIPYYGGQYASSAGFGLVIMSTDGERFHLDAELLGKQIENRVSALANQAEWIGVLTAVSAFLLAAALAFGIARPILRLTTASSEIERDRWDRVDVDTLLSTPGQDEVARLTRVFASMSREVRSRIVQLRQQVEQMQIVIDETKREREVKEIVDSDFFQDLTQRARELRQRRQRPTPPPGPSSDAPA